MVLLKCRSEVFAGPQRGTADPFRTIRKSPSPHGDGEVRQCVAGTHEIGASPRQLAAMGAYNILFVK